MLSLRERRLAYASILMMALLSIHIYHKYQSIFRFVCDQCELNYGPCPQQSQ